MSNRTGVVVHSVSAGVDDDGYTHIAQMHAALCAPAVPLWLTPPAALADPALCRDCRDLYTPMPPSRGLAG